MLSERSLAVLHAIVSDFVSDGEPVGSKSIVEKHGLNVSAATVRNDMAILEEEELIIAPHTSSGRIPTDKGYRLYVDTLAKIRPLTPSQRTAIERFLGESVNLEDMMSRSVRLLANLTNQVAVIQYPTVSNVHIRHVELIKIASRTVLLVLITNTARVQQHVINFEYDDPHADEIQKLKESINSKLSGTDLKEAQAQVTSLAASPQDEMLSSDYSLQQKTFQALFSLLSEHEEQKITVAGAANLTRLSQEPQELAAMLDAIEEQVTLLRLIQELATGERGIGVSIGKENVRYGLPDSSLLATEYESVQEHLAARLGVFGPTRMDYARNIAAMRAVSNYIGKFLGQNPF